MSGQGLIKISSRCLSPFEQPAQDFGSHNEQGASPENHEDKACP